MRKAARRKGRWARLETLRFAHYVIQFTTFTKKEIHAAQVLEWYRLRWQVELAFKRLKSLAQMGHLPKSDDDSTRAWLYGKLQVALLGQKIIQYAAAISLWEYDVARQQGAQCVAGVQVRPQPSHPRD